MNTTIQKIQEATAKNEATAAREYRDLVNAVANEKNIKPADATATLAAAGKTVDDLAADVAARQRRDLLRAKIATLPALHREATEVNRAHAIESQKLEAAQARYSESAAPLLARGREIDLAIREIESAKAQLAESCDDSELLEQIDAANLQWNALHAEKRALAKVAEAKREGERELDRANRQLSQRMKKLMVSQAEKKIAATGNVDERLAELAGEIAAQAEIIRQLEAQKLSV